MTHDPAWRQRLQARAEESLRRRVAAAAARRDRQQRRAHGLVERHAARQARVREAAHPFPPDPGSAE
ncbi:hypothetical protein [Actinoplanes sp. NPDC051859]|uniref:hypothetical protein n=1 Tax=Actinoplanes sp. NPDC051859 TaxID=3363909 RepID=UPI0037B22FD2